MLPNNQTNQLRRQVCWFNYLCIPLGSLLALLWYCLLSPCTTTIHAIESASDNTPSPQSSTSASLIIDGGTINNDPISAEYDQTAYNAHTITVNASNIADYFVSLSYDKGSTALTGDSGNTIPNVASNTKGSSIPSNSWGYGWGATATTNENLTYNPLLPGDNILEQAQTNTINSTKKLVFAVRFGQNSPNGHYKANIVLSLTATPKQISGLRSITYMQEMTASICQDSQEHDTKQLIDNRDGKTYWVTKLKDGNCWMTQNLDLDLRNITLNGTNTSTTSSWTPNLTSSKWMVTSSDNSARYYDDGVVICNSSGCSKASGTYDEHYLMGNHYSWGAATANTGSSVTTGNNSNSICPKGWQLPLGTNANKSYANLITAYSGQDLTAAPVYLIKSGHVGNNNLFGTGTHGWYWTSSAENSTSIYILRLETTASATTTTVRSDGNTIRCVAK